MKKAALITGAAKRIGKGIALALAGDGFDIGLHYGHSEEEAEQTADEIRKRGVECHLLQADFKDMDAVMTLVPEMFHRFPQCNVLINNASVFHRTSFLDTTPEEFEHFFNIHLKAPFFLSQQFACRCPIGNIVNILDTKITKNIDTYFPYLLSKKALYELTHLSAKALGPEIRVNGVAPGIILPSTESGNDEIRRMVQKLPLKRQGEVEDIVSAVRFLVNHPFLTGECIFVDGGEHLN